ncbi:unnamed protein product [Prorocentrum cordatum]|uniref:Sulfhydryl oxidase n=1 Tax=Prorocentrum cordatum TaxID=2364126 RepID=A0ABN9PK38_9DINO|nr:unnamed protein product [Polarella glacialis]
MMRMKGTNLFGDERGSRAQRLRSPSFTAYCDTCWTSVLQNMAELRTQLRMTRSKAGWAEFATSASKSSDATQAHFWNWLAPECSNMPWLCTSCAYQAGVNNDTNRLSDCQPNRRQARTRRGCGSNCWAGRGAERRAGPHGGSGRGVSKEEEEDEEEEEVEEEEEPTRRPARPAVCLWSRRWRWLRARGPRSGSEAAD